MCPPMSPRQGRIRCSILVHDACVLGMETPLRGRSGGHTGAAPTVSFGWIVCGRLISFVWDCVEKYYGNG